MVSALGPKQLEILHEILPSAGTIVLLVNADNPNAQAEAAAHVLGQRLEVLTASTDGDLDAPREGRDCSGSWPLPHSSSFNPHARDGRDDLRRPLLTRLPVSIRTPVKSAISLA
jgi:hypothetical protein